MNKKRWKNVKRVWYKRAYRQQNHENMGCLIKFFKTLSDIVWGLDI